MAGIKCELFHDNFQNYKCYDSVKEAAKSVGVHDTKVSAVCKGNRKTTGGHSFRFLTREEAEKVLKTKEG